MKFQNCTLYHNGMLGFSAIECKEVSIVIGKYAQYPSAVHVTFVPKGKRKDRGFVQTFEPSVVVAAGFGNPDPQNMVPISNDGVVAVSRSKYSSCDSRWISDFQAEILPKLEVLFNAIGHNSHSPAPSLATVAAC